ncbi:MAG: rod shape-determining protein MreC, partial [Acidobacteria bacterium]|nr:rod shape-determining protein MreC [Acidobacteriota bacterium]
LISYGTPFTRSILVSLSENSVTKVKSPVVDQFGVVGRIEEISGAKARVLLLIDPSSAIGIIDQRSGVSGVAVGNGKNLVAKYITNEADVIEGDIFVTSGQDEVFPYGIPVGRAVLVQDGGDYLKKIVIAPFASLESLSYVLILQNPK